MKAQLRTNSKHSSLQDGQVTNVRTKLQIYHKITSSKTYIVRLKYKIQQHNSNIYQLSHLQQVYEP